VNPLLIDKNRCKACSLCISVCNKHLLELADELNAKGYHPIRITDQERCTSCALCGVVCPEGALTVYKPFKQKKAA